MEGDIFRLTPGRIIMINDTGCLYISLVVEHDHYNKIFKFKDYLFKDADEWNGETVVYSYSLFHLRIESDDFKILCEFPPDAKEMISKDIESFEEKYPEYFV